MMDRPSATEPIPVAARAGSALVAAERAIHEADPSAFFVASRIVRRAIRHEVDLPALTARIPHRKSFHLSGERAGHIVSNDELGLENGAPLPETVILLARPEEHEREAMSPAALREHLRRLHFHARVHVILEERQARGLFDEQIVERRIQNIGYTAFDEIRSVLDQEAYLLPPVSASSVYVEFAAVFLELRYFAPDLLTSYFPSLDNLARIEEILAQDVDADTILQMTAELKTDDLSRPAPQEEERAQRRFSSIGFAAIPSRRSYEALLRRAAKAAERGNDVRAAILHIRAAAIDDHGLAVKAAAHAAADLRRLEKRLNQALRTDSSESDPWRDLLAALLEQSAYGFWNPSARLLYDLQKACLDSEREAYVVDLLSWLVSFGRRPLKRPLPAQREVLISKHLRVATSRLGKLPIESGQREHLSMLLQAAAVSAEERLRERLRPPLEETLIEVGFLPQNLPERVSFRKIIEELLDAVVERGFFAMGDIRDAIARNNVKLDDVADPLELIAGDRLLRADRRLSEVLDGVYQRGAIYLRGLQRLSSCAFGTKVGRFLTLYVAMPFGGAYVILAFVDHVMEAGEKLSHWWAGTEAPHTPASHPNLLATGALGLLLLSLIHVPQLRSALWQAIRWTGRGLRFAFYDFPILLAEITLINRLLRSTPVVFFRKRLLTSVVLTGLFCGLFPAAGWYQLPRPSITASIFIGLVVLLNSRFGRDLEELLAERLQLMWHRIRVHVFVALFDLVMDFFKQVLELLERVLYEVDEWLRFKSGESQLTLRIKAVLGLPWSIARFVVGFLVTVLVEPQINPIKHFPVVTVSHKVILPMQPMLASPLDPVFGKVLANTIAGITVLLLPGVVGFLVWELRGNWRLYAVNRHKELKPVIVGSHGETLVRLLKMSVHSGTLPRLFARLRRAGRRANPARRLRGLMGYYAKLHHLELNVRRFVEREFVSFLTESTAFEGVVMEVGRTELGTNSLRAEIRAPQLGDDPMWIAFEEDAGRMVAGVWRTGWATTLSEPQRNVLAGLLVGFYRIGGVDLVREQIEVELGPRASPYNVTEAGLTLLPGTTRQTTVIYDLDEVPTIVPRPEGPPNGSASPDYPPVKAVSLVFNRTRTLWREWVDAWSRDDAREVFPALLPPEAHPESFVPRG
jgi:hypothetical protein